tara:strand:+ start:448 stop:858 length:411 start_codon:yes stop_codon:yes gene_type:complete
MKKNIKNVKYKKLHLIVYKKKTDKFLLPKFKIFGFRIVESGFLSTNAVEAARRILIRHVRGFGSVFVCLKPSLWLTKKPSDVRMGKGKGSPYKQIIPVQSGKFLFEWDGLSEEQAKDLFVKSSRKIPLRAKFIVKH